MELPSTTPLKTDTNSMYFQFCSSALSPPVSSAEATWCCRDVERKQNAENESARGTEGAGELYTYYYYWHTQREPLRRRDCSAWNNSGIKKRANGKFSSNCKTSLGLAQSILKHKFPSADKPLKKSLWKIWAPGLSFGILRYLLSIQAVTTVLLAFVYVNTTLLV